MEKASLKKKDNKKSDSVQVATVGRFYEGRDNSS
jgi:hypothetical protein